MPFFRLEVIVYPSGGTIDGAKMPPRSKSEKTFWRYICGAFYFCIYATILEEEAELIRLLVICKLLDIYPAHLSYYRLRGVALEPKRVPGRGLVYNLEEANQIRELLAGVFERRKERKSMRNKTREAV
jgi:hypothetical protein